MKILFPFVGDTVGGSHHSAQILIKELVKKGYQPKILIHMDGVLEPFFRKKVGKIPILMNLPFWKASESGLLNLWRQVILVPKLYSFLRKHRIDIVHVNDSRMVLTWVLPTKILGIPLIAHQRTKYVPSRIVNFSLRISTRVVGISDYVAKSLPRKVQRNTEIVLNPFENKGQVDKHEMKKMVIQEFNFKLEIPLIVVVGTINKQKRPSFALKAFFELLKRGHLANLLIVGRNTKEETDAIKKFINQYKLQSMVAVSDYRNDVKKIIAGADLLVAPAIDEGHGRTLIEAMLLETPVIASASGGHLEIIKHQKTGLLFDPFDIMSLTNQMQIAFESKNLTKKIARSSKAFCLETFHINKHVNSLLKIYRQSSGCVAVVIESMQGGGAQQVASALLTEWVNRGDKPILITFKDAKSDQVNLPAELKRFTVGDYPISKGLFSACYYNIQRLIKIRKVLKESGAKRAVSFITSTNILTILAAIMTDIKVIVSERNDLERQPIKKSWQILRWVLYRFAWRVTANSLPAILSMKTFVKNDRLVLTPNPLRNQAKISKKRVSKPFILAVGRLHEQKNYEAIITTFASLKLVGWQLVILGEGKERKKLEKLAENLNIAAQVSFKGFVEDPFPYYRSARLFIMMSHYEGSPNALWEALASGLPCIISKNIENVNNLLRHGENILIVEHNNPQQLREMILQIIKDKHLQKKISDGALKITVNLSTDKVLKAWDEAIFCQLPTNHNAPSV